MFDIMVKEIKRTLHVLDKCLLTNKLGITYSLIS